MPAPTYKVAVIQMHPKVKHVDTYMLRIIY